MRVLCSLGKSVAKNGWAQKKVFRGYHEKLWYRSLQKNWLKVYAITKNISTLDAIFFHKTNNVGVAKFLAISCRKLSDFEVKVTTLMNCMHISKQEFFPIVIILTVTWHQNEDSLFCIEVFHSWSTTGKSVWWLALVREWNSYSVNVNSNENSRLDNLSVETTINQIYEVTARPPIFITHKSCNHGWFQTRHFERILRLSE